MSDIGLDALTDDQLVELARSIATEVAKRNPAVADAAQAAIRDEIAKAARSQDNLWAKKKWLAMMIKDHIGAGCELTVWRATDRDVTRVYIDEPGSDRRGRDRIKWCLHVTGDSKNPPGTLTKEEGSRASTQADSAAVKIICQHAIKAFTSVRIDCDKAAATTYATPPMPEDFTARIAEIAQHKAAEAARDAHREEVRVAVYADYNAALAAAFAAQPDAKYDFQLATDVRDRLDVIRAKAHQALTAAMVKYDRQHGETK